jgi:hypothetical protein
MKCVWALIVVTVLWISDNDGANSGPGKYRRIGKPISSAKQWAKKLKATKTPQKIGKLTLGGALSSLSAAAGFALIRKIENNLDEDDSMSKDWLKLEQAKFEESLKSNGMWTYSGIGLMAMLLSAGSLWCITSSMKKKKVEARDVSDNENERKEGANGDKNEQKEGV